jgi:hypothetical protein
MKDSLTERVLARVMDWEEPQVVDYGAILQLLASHKYDSYEGYRPGVKFLEHLIAWVDQFPDREDRRRAVEFVLKQLVFVSRAELTHLIETVYPDHIQPLLIRKAAERLGVSRFAVSEIVGSDEFVRLRRSTLVLGLSDGAHIDQLRRASPGLSHEQIFLATDIGDETMRDAVEKLREATEDPNARFEQVLLVDDFYGSGESLLRVQNGKIKGRLWRTKSRLEHLATSNNDGNETGSRRPGRWGRPARTRFRRRRGGRRTRRPASPDPSLSKDFAVSILVYIASHQAIDHVERMLDEVGLGWRLDVVQPLPEDAPVVDPQMQAICEGHYDRILTDKHKKVDVPLGYANCALPLVLQHNTPNNSICILWGDTTERAGSLRRRALFPRYERHQEGRN